MNTSQRPIEGRGRHERLMAGRLPVVLALALIIAVWTLLTGPLAVPRFLLPSPLDVGRRLISGSSSLLFHLGLTATSSAVGLVLGCLVGWGAAMLFSWNRTVEKGFYPYFIALKSVPIVVLAPFVSLWFGTDLVSRIVLVTLTTFFPVLVTCLRGLRRVDPALLELFTICGATKWRSFVALRIPSSAPYLSAGAKVSSVLAVVAALVAEMLGADSGLGFVLMISLYRIDTAGLVCVTILSCLLSLVLFGTVGAVERLLIPWSQASEPTASEV